jgi:hypothetical protein
LVFGLCYLLDDNLRATIPSLGHVRFNESGYIRSLSTNKLKIFERLIQYNKNDVATKSKTQTFSLETIYFKLNSKENRITKNSRLEIRIRHKIITFKNYKNTKKATLLNLTFTKAKL